MAHSQKWKYVRGAGLMGLVTYWVIRSVRKANWQEVALAPAATRRPARVTTLWIVQPTRPDSVARLLRAVDSPDPLSEQASDVAAFLKGSLDFGRNIKLFVPLDHSADATSKILGGALKVAPAPRGWLNTDQLASYRETAEHDVIPQYMIDPEVQIILVARDPAVATNVWEGITPVEGMPTLYAATVRLPR